MRTVSSCRVAIVVAVLIFLVSFTMTSAAQTVTDARAKKMKNPVAADAKSIEAGQKIFLTSCAPCHGQAGKGDGPVAANMKEVKPSNLADDKWDHGAADGEIFATIRDGIGPKFTMKAYKEKVKEGDLWNLVNFIRSIGPRKKS